MWYIYTKKYYLAIKNNRVVPFAATWMDLETVIQSEVSRKIKSNTYNITDMWNLEKWLR